MRVGVGDGLVRGEEIKWRNMQEIARRSEGGAGCLVVGGGGRRNGGGLW